MKRLFVAVSIIILLFSVNAGAEEKGWNLIIDKNDIKVYSRPVPGSVINEFKGETVANSRIEVIGEVFQDIKAMPEWMPDCKSVEVLKELESEVFHIIVYTVTNSPWPVRDRDAIGDTVLSIDPDTGNLIATVTAIREPLVPLHHYNVRITDLKQQFIFEHLTNNRTKITCIFRVDPGGYVPKFFTNIVIRLWPYNVLKNLKEQALKAKYAKAAEAAKSSRLGKVIVKKMYEGKIRKNVKDKKLVELLFKDTDLFQLVFNATDRKKEPVELLEEHIKSNYYQNGGTWHRR